MTAVGSGDAFNGAGRGHTCWLVEDALGLALIDCGATALQGLWRSGVDPQRVAAVHFTHLHGDHIGGWPFLLVDALYRARRTAPLLVSGPPGTRERLSMLFAACYADAAGRALPFPLEVTELQPGDSASLCGRRVTALRAQHMRPPHLALSLRLEGPSYTLGFTGDTGAHPGLIDVAAGADALFAECSELHPPPPDAAVPGAAADYPREAGRRHLAWDELRALLPALAAAMPAPRIALAHLSAEVRAARPRIEEEIRELGLAVKLCDDGDALDLP